MSLSWAGAILLTLLQTPATQAVKPSSVHETAHLRVTTSGGEQAEAGKRVTLKIDVAPKPKMHVYAPGQPDYIVVSVALDPDPAFTAAAPKFPPPEKLFFAPLNEEQLVYSHPFQITQNVALTRPAAGKASVTIKGTLRYQACDDVVCFLPTKVPVEWTVKIQ